MNDKKWMIHQNLAFLRKSRQLSLEEVAERVGVSRQAVGKWESGETVPAIVNCDALAELYNVSVDDLLHYDGGELKLGPGPRGKHIFGITVMGERGQVVIPKQARELFQLKPGNRLMVLGDETPGNRGLALVDADTFLDAAKEIVEQFCPKGRRDET